MACCPAARLEATRIEDGLARPHLSPGDCRQCRAHPQNPGGAVSDLADTPPANPMHRGHSNLTAADLDRMATEALEREPGLAGRVAALEGMQNWLLLWCVILTAACLVLIAKGYQ